MEPDETAGQDGSPPGPGPQADLAAFLERHYRDFLTAAMSVGATFDDAQEAVQTALADMFKRGTWSRLTRNPHAWIRIAVRHAYYDQQKKRRRYRGIESQPPPVSCLDDSLNSWEGWQWVQQNLSRLPPAQREVFELILLELSTQEIADLLGKTPDAVRQNLAHARRRLKANLGQDHEIDPDKPRRKEDTP